MGLSNVSLPTTVTPGNGAQFYDGIAGEALAQGEMCYVSTVDNKLYKSIGSSQAAAKLKGMAVNAAGANQPIRIQTEGPFANGSGLVKGQHYVISDDVAGDIMLPADLGTGDWSAYALYATATTAGIIKPIITDQQLA